ncbi:hypothetical protein C8R46DRAFT_1119802 [Mycena filopes]|nr:hypothetical protein C8R46DRAFT_1119802 [Mycena filopes]
MTTPTPTSEDPTAGLPNEFTVESAELRDEVSARTPIRFSATNEPYLPLPAPFERFYLSPMRVADLPHDMGMMNDIRVARTLWGPPFPVTLLGAQRWLVQQRALSTELFAAYAAGSFLPAGSAPFEVLRERLPSGGEEYVGQVTVMYAGDKTVRTTPVNAEWEEWRTRTKVWGIGAALRAEFHRQGIATAAVAVVMKDWAIPQMGCTELHADCFVSNVGSVKIWERYGFVENPALRGEVTLPESKGGGVEATFVLVWHLK